MKQIADLADGWCIMRNGFEFNAIMKKHFLMDLLQLWLPSNDFFVFLLLSKIVVAWRALM
jgi:hypothetical protein